ncbi:MAG: RES domain-containing protein [Saprospiraceae bacterium]|nr:RES domain-containing protein [Saprospiraceae bacterium]
MITFRLTKEQYKYDLSGKGSEITGGRWNSKGVAVLYTSFNRALCMAEVLVHQPAGKLSSDFWLTSIECPQEILSHEVNINDLPDNWRIFPPPLGLKAIGDSFILEQKNAGLIVPSAVVPGEKNLLLNPKHPDFCNIQIIQSEIFVFDSRLIR